MEWQDAVTLNICARGGPRVCDFSGDAPFKLLKFSRVGPLCILLHPPSLSKHSNAYAVIASHSIQHIPTIFQPSNSGDAPFKLLKFSRVGPLCILLHPPSLSKHSNAYAVIASHSIRHIPTIFQPIPTYPTNANSEI